MKELSHPGHIILGCLIGATRLLIVFQNVSPLIWKASSVLWFNAGNPSIYKTGSRRFPKAQRENRKNWHTWVQRSRHVTTYTKSGPLSSKSSKRCHKEPRKAKSEKWKNMFIPYVAENSKFKLTSNRARTLRQKLIHPQDKTHRHMLSNVAYAVQWTRRALTFI